MKTFFGVLLSIIIVPLFIILVIYFSITGTFLNPKTIPNIFAKNQIYTEVINIVLPNFFKGLNTQNLSDADKAQMQQMIDNAKTQINPQYLQTQIEKNYPTIVDYLNGKKINLDVNVDLSTLSNLLSNQSFTQSMLSDDMLKKQFDSWGECKSDQTSDCRPPDMTFEEFKKMVNEQTISQNQNTAAPNNQNIIPSQYNLSQSQPTINTLNSIKQFLSIANLISYILITIIIICLIIIVLMFKRELPRMLKYLGIIFIIPNILLLFMSGGFLASWRTVAGAFSSGFNLPPEMINIVVNIFGGITGSMMTQILIISLIFLAGSIVCFIYANKLNKNIKK